MTKKLDFIVVGLPRSGTTWAANWLTTEQSVCWHDPLLEWLPQDLDVRESTKPYRGISCTASWAWKTWFENHPAKKIILTRNIDEIQDSLVQLGIPPLKQTDIDCFNNIEGIRIDYRELWNNPKEMWEYLLPAVPFDAERHAQLSLMNIQPVTRVMVPDSTQVKRLLADLSAELKRD